MGELSLMDSPIVTREMMRDLIDLRIAVAAADKATIDTRWSAVATKIRAQGKPEHTVEAFRQTFAPTADER